MEKNIVAGLDVGSTAAKAVLLDADTKTLLTSALLPTGWNAKQAGKDVLCAACQNIGIQTDDVKVIIATGYGRISLPFAQKSITEITCHAMGASFLIPETRMLLDIGGQDSKVVLVDTDGSVMDFVMNDKCAAGTGRFLQVVAGILDMDLPQLGEAAQRGKPANISSMCAVFAETEIIGLLANGVLPEDIAAGVFVSIAKRVKSLIRRMPQGNICTFTGGLATNQAFCQILENVLDMQIKVPQNPQCVGALGAAILAIKLV